MKKGSWLFAHAPCNEVDNPDDIEIKLGAPMSYRGAEIDRYTAMTFMTWLSHWDDNYNFYGSSWEGQFNHDVVQFMAPLLLDHPYMRGSMVYNWREGPPIITRNVDGSIKVNEVIYQRDGYPFAGG